MIKKNIVLIIPFLLICCNRSKEDNRNLLIEYNSQKLEKTGEILYSKFCLECHGSKGANDNFLVGNIQNNKYELSFLMYYINHQDSLLQHKNKIKDEWSNNEYIHNFKLTEKEIKSIVCYLKK